MIKIKEVFESTSYMNIQGVQISGKVQHFWRTGKKKGKMNAIIIFVSQFCIIVTSKLRL